ncbi:hypothetical protein [Bryobacter aggregatus]|uniref:hypothetical protein n=1 Tax=Bryobacter aggregatus TaxID=360054 RepID=UPI0004E19FA4|nr:hypothetical protein [Bryobacter aggregatus]
MWRAALLLFLASLSWGQILLRENDWRAKEIATYFEGGIETIRKESSRLNCEIQPIPSRLSYNFQFWTGYDVLVPMREFASGGRDKPILMALEVISETNGKKSYFFAPAQLPRNAPPEAWTSKNTMMNLGGGFLTGPGRFRVSLLVADGQGRTCTKAWKLEAAKLDVPLQLAPGAVAANGLNTWKGLVGGSGKLSLYVHAAPLLRRKVKAKLSAWEQNVLLSSMKSLLESGGFEEARVTVFDFDGRRVLFESEHFDAAAFEKLTEALADLNLGTVSAKTLAGPDESSLLADLMGKELQRNGPSNAVVFLGPSWRYGPKISPLLREQRNQMPPTFYVTLTPWQSSTSDLIEKFVRTGPKGKVIAVYRPEDLARAIREIREKRNSPAIPGPNVME